MKISSIHVYPIKSLSGISLLSSKVTLRGLEFDRRWMLVDEQMRFITQRDFPQLAHFFVKITDKDLIVSYQNDEIEIDLEPQTNIALKVQIWDDIVLAYEVKTSISSWFSIKLGIRCKLVYQPESSIRPIDNHYSVTQTEHTSFADGYPILMISEASLAALNEKCEEQIEIARFRPNIVIENAEPFQEDKLKAFKINDILFYGVKPCARCLMTTINLQNLQKSNEPLKTLSNFRKEGNKILFGQNVVIHSEGFLSVGDTLIISK
jgi:uncharacterized protein